MRGANRNVEIAYVKHQGVIVVAGYVTTRAVHAGEEALAMYGKTYWRPGVGSAPQFSLEELD